MSRLTKSIFIDAPLEKVAEYGKNPNGWAHWYAHLSEPKKLVGDGEVGTVGEFTYSMLGMHLPMMVEVKEWSAGPDKYVWSGTFEGPLSGTQKVTYLPNGDGTDVTLEIEYTVPGNIFGKIADLILLEKVQENATVATLENLKAFCEAM